MWGTGKLPRRASLGRRQPDRPGRLPRLQRQHLRRAAPVERGHAPRRQSRSLAHRRGHGASLAGGVLGPPPRRSQRHRARAVPHAPPVRAQAVLPLRALRHRRRGARAGPRSGAVGRQPSELLRRGRAGARRAWHRPPRALPRQEGDLRRARRRDDRPCHRRHRRRSRQRVGPAPPGCRVRAEGGRGGDRAPAGHHPARVRLLRPGAARQDGDGPAGGVDGRHGRARGLWGTEKVWPRSARVPDFTLVRNPPKVTVRVGRPVPLSLTDAKADTSAIMAAIERAAAPRGRGCVTSRPPRSWLAASPLGEGTARQRDDARRQRHFAPSRARPRHGGRRPGRAPARPPPARAPERGAPGRARHRHQREDHDDSAAHGGARRDGRRRREQRDRFEHAPGARRRAGGVARPACRPRDGRGLPAPRAHRDVGRHGGPAQPVAGPARPDQRGAHDRGALAGGAGGRAAHPRRGQRRRPSGGVGGGRRPRRALGGCRPSLAARCRRLPFLRRPHRVHG